MPTLILNTIDVTSMKTCSEYNVLLYFSVDL